MSVEQIKRQVKVLEFYLKGRIQQLNNLAKGSPAEASSYEMCASELQLIYDQVLPELQNSLK